MSRGETTAVRQVPIEHMSTRCQETIGCPSLQIKVTLQTILQTICELIEHLRRQETSR